MSPRVHRFRGGPLVAANHACRSDLETTHGNDPAHALERSIARHERMEEMLSALPADADVRTLESILADAGVEQRYPDRTTVFSTVACPATGEMWFACGRGPAASTGTWTQVEWPW